MQISHNKHSFLGGNMTSCLTGNFCGQAVDLKTVTNSFMSSGTPGSDSRLWCYTKVWMARKHIPTGNHLLIYSSCRELLPKDKRIHGTRHMDRQTEGKRSRTWIWRDAESHQKPFSERQEAGEGKGHTHTHMHLITALLHVFLSVWMWVVHVHWDGWLWSELWANPASAPN